MVGPETAATKTLDSVAKYLGRADAGDANFDQTVSSISGDELTIDTAQHLTDLDLEEGDMVAIVSTQAGEINMVLDPASASTKCTMVKNPLASHAAAIKVYKLTQIPVVMV